jgi:hypothetical protein
MIYNVGNTSAIGKRCKVFDANNVEIVRCVEVDTDTGLVVRQKIPREIQNDGIVTVQEKAKLPIRIEWVEV